MGSVVNKSKNVSIQGLDVYLVVYRNMQTGFEHVLCEVNTSSNNQLMMQMLFPKRETLVLNEQDKKSLNNMLREFKKIWFN